MKTIYQFADKVERALESGIARDESQWDRKYLIDAINEGRGEVIRNDYKMFKRIAPECVVKHWPEYSELAQDDCKCIKFNIPATINVGDRNGIVYIGSSTQNRTYVLLKNRTQLSDYLKHPRLWSLSNVYVLYEGVSMEMYSKFDIQNPLIELIPANPMDIPEFNADVDPYPISTEMEGQIMLYLQNRFNPQVGSPDKISDSRDASQQPQVRR